MKAIVIEVVIPIREYVVDLLEKEGFSVDQTDNGTIGLELINKNDYQLVVTNVWLNELPGSTMIRKVRAEGINCPVLIHSARMCWFDVIEGYMTGADDYMFMPSHPHEFLSRIRHLISGTNPVRPKELLDARETMSGAQKRKSLPTEDEWLAMEKERLDRREKRNNHCKGLVVE